MTESLQLNTVLITPNGGGYYQGMMYEQGEKYVLVRHTEPITQPKGGIPATRNGRTFCFVLCACAARSRSIAICAAQRPAGVGVSPPPRSRRQNSNRSSSPRNRSNCALLSIFPRPVIVRYVSGRPATIRAQTARALSPSMLRKRI